MNQSLKKQRKKQHKKALISVLFLTFGLVPCSFALAPVQCSSETQAQLSGKTQNLGVFEDLKVMRVQTALFLECVRSALGPKGSDQWGEHPYALLSDLYEQGLPYLDTSAMAVASLRKSVLEAVFDRIDHQIQVFTTKYPPRHALYQTAHALQEWLQSVRAEASEQSEGSGGYLATAKSEILFGAALREALTRQYRTAKKKLCAFKNAADQELLIQGVQNEFPAVPPQIIYCAPLRTQKN